MKDKFLVVGLGNPEEKWKSTRHNIGWNVLLDIEGLQWKNVDKGYLAKKDNIYFLRPSTGMNSSGEAVYHWVNELRIKLDHLLIIVDDLDLPFGKIRLKGKGSARHNGLKSIENCLGTSIYPRLKIGIGKNFKPDGQLEFVLGEFNEEELLILPEIIEAAKSAVEVFLEESTIDKAMSKIN